MLYAVNGYSDDTDYGENGSTSDSSEDSDGGEFRPPPGAIRTMKLNSLNNVNFGDQEQYSNHQKMTMRLRSSPRKFPSDMASPNRQQRTSPRKNNDLISTPSKSNAASTSQIAHRQKRLAEPIKKEAPFVPDGANDRQQIKHDSMARQGHKRVDLIRQNAVVGRKRGRKRKEATTDGNRTEPKKEENGVKKKRGRKPGSSNLLVKREILSTEDDEEDEEDYEFDDDDLFAIASDSSSAPDQEEEECSESDKKMLQCQESSQNIRAAKLHAKAQFNEHLRKEIHHHQSDGMMVQPKKRGRKPAVTNKNSVFIKKTDTGKKWGTGRMALLMPNNNPAFDYSNPYDEVVELALMNEELDDENLLQQNHILHLHYQRRMRDLIDFYRYLGRPDQRGLCRRPVHRPFLLRNLFYTRKQKPLVNVNSTLFNNCLPDSKIFHMAYGLQRITSTKDVACGSRTASRTSNKIPATIKFTLIRNNNCFGNKTAIVQCFHVTEVNGRLGQLKRIPSATFEKAVNEKINTYIDIDILEECQPAALDCKYPKAEHFVVRVVFRLEDAEIGGRHLRKMPSRQSADEHSSKSLRKNGPMDAREVVMFGSVQIFSHSIEHGMRSVAGETHILLYTAAELFVDDLNTKSSAGQIARLINANAQTCKRTAFGGGDFPFIRIVMLNEDDEEDEEEEEAAMEEKEDGDAEDRETRKLAVSRMMDELAEIEAATSEYVQIDGTTVTAGARRRTANNGVVDDDHQQKGLFDPLPSRIAIKFPLQSPNLYALSQPYQPNAAMQNINYARVSSDSQPDLKRARLHFSDSSADEPMSHEDSDQDQYWQERFDDSVAGFAEADKSHPKRQHTIRVILPSQCFLCKARLKLQNLWTLHRHLRFVHPRFDFKYEPNIPIDVKGDESVTTLPGFTLLLNTRFDASFELRPIPKNRRKSRLACHFGGSLLATSVNMKKQTIGCGNTQNGSSSRPVWLVTKTLAMKMRADDRFPIERFTALTYGGNWGEYEYLLSVGRFSFDTPTRVDQQWLIQTGSRKLEDITDLHPAERLMMQMWNAFLPRIRITMLGHKLIYQAARVFVRHYWRQIEQYKLRTHFLLHLTTLITANAIDEDERYDLVMRLDCPKYQPQEDAKHWVARELALLEKDRMGGGGQKGGGGITTQHECGGSDDGTIAIEKQQQQKHAPRIVASASNVVNSKKQCNNMRHHPLPQQQNVPPAVVDFKSLAALRARYPFATNKRMERIWKFVRHYDFADFTMISSSSLSAQANDTGSTQPSCNLATANFRMAAMDPPPLCSPSTSSSASSYSSASSSSSSATNSSSASSGFFSGSNISTNSASSNSMAAPHLSKKVIIMGK